MIIVAVSWVDVTIKPFGLYEKQILVEHHVSRVNGSNGAWGIVWPNRLRRQ